MIDPGELLLACTGVSPFLRGEIPRITLKLLEDAARLPKRVEELARQSYGALQYAPSTSPSYDELRAYFDKPLDPSYVHAITEKFPDDAMELAVPFSTAVQHAIEYLRTMFPRSTYETFVGPRPLTPDDQRWSKFRMTLSLLDDPTRMFGLVSRGGLMRFNVECLEKVYPSFLAAARADLDKARVEKLAENDKYLVPPRLQLSLSALTGRKADVHSASTQPNPPKSTGVAPKPPVNAQTAAEKAANV